MLYVNANIRHILESKCANAMYSRIIVAGHLICIILNMPIFGDALDSMLNSG